MESDDYKPRAHDHLVEPVFAGLGAQAEEGVEVKQTSVEVREELVDRDGRVRQRAYKWSSMRSRFWQRVRTALRTLNH